MDSKRDFVWVGFLALWITLASPLSAQYRQGPGHSIGTVTTQGNLIVLTMDPDVLGKANLLNLGHRSLRFTPEGSRYRVETVPTEWDPDFGPEMAGSDGTLKNFAFPFSGKSWSAFSVGMMGNLTFGEPAVQSGNREAGATEAKRMGWLSGGLSIDRFAELQQAASEIVNTVPAISVFFKPRMTGVRYLKEVGDHAVVTWSLTEPFGGVQDMSWSPTVNRFQAVLCKDGSIQFNYDEIHAEDAIVGVYPMVTQGKEIELASVASGGNAGAPANLDIRKARVAVVDGLFLKITIETRGPVLQEDNPEIVGIAYAVCLDHAMPAEGCPTNAETRWTIQGSAGRGRGVTRTPRYYAFGPGLSQAAKVSGNTISMQGILPAGYKAGDRVYLSASASKAASASNLSPAVDSPAVTTGAIAPQPIRLMGIVNPEVDLASLTKRDGPFSVVYESFHYMRPPRAADLTCSVLKALGDKFDMLAYYSDFRIDNPEAGTSSTGPLGGGLDGGAVTGIGAEQRNLAAYCTQGRFQWQFIQPVYVGANQMQEYPPDGLTESNTHNVAAYSSQLAERTANGKIPPYDYAMSQIGHEMGHRWSAFVSAKVNGETIQLGPTHWARGLQAPVAFPYQRPTEASAMEAAFGRTTSMEPLRNWMTTTMCLQPGGLISISISWE